MPPVAVGLVLLMDGATITHLRRHETAAVVLPLALLALALPGDVALLRPQPFSG